jgi:hypothetical protein
MTASRHISSVRTYSALVASEDDCHTSHFLLTQSLKLVGRGRLYRRGMRPGTWLSKYLKKRTECLNIKLSVVFRCLHCNENSIYVFLFWELHSLSPNFHIHVSVSDLFIPRISPHISCSRIGRSNVGNYKSLTHA